ncbi:ATPase domain of HSP90 chaperone/DNA topoisomerase II/histidine kinase, partial [Imleria badia]
MQDREELWRTGKDEPAEVNQRALIDKVLARYSGEFAVFRELLQNSDDARSSKVEIHFETADHLDRRTQGEENPDASTLPDLKCACVTQWTFRNNGDPFTEQDWTRLQKIAEGNPGPEKIGAFGVGFYSLFSVTDRPFVSSQGYGMQFHWRDNKDQLYVRRGNLPSREIPNQWTTFEMPLREAGPIPPALDFLRFLASSITFMVNLR